MATWGLIREATEPRIGHEGFTTEMHVLARVEGTREEALAELERHVRRLMDDQPKKRHCRRIFRNGDDFLLIINRRGRSLGSRFTVAELLEDPHAPVNPPDAREAKGIPNGAPVKPTWLGRFGKAAQDPPS